MTYTRHIHGKHYMEYSGSRPAIWWLRLTGSSLGLKKKLIYKGTK